MKVNKATLEGMTLRLELGDAHSRQEAARTVAGFKDGDYTLTRKRKKRSLDANAYCWVLIDKIAAEMGISKTEVYKSALREIGGVSDTVCVLEKAFPRLKRSWERQGLGWQCIQEKSKIPGCVNAVLIYGSSAFDTKQMSRLIDGLVQEANALGIDTMSDAERSLLLEGWDGK